MINFERETWCPFWSGFFQKSVDLLHPQLLFSGLTLSAQNQSIPEKDNITQNIESLPGVNVVLKALTKESITPVDGTNQIGLPLVDGTLLYFLAGYPNFQIQQKAWPLDWR